VADRPPRRLIKLSHSPAVRSVDRTEADLARVPLPFAVWCGPNGLCVLVAQVNDAEPIALRIGEDDEVGVLRISVPLDTLCAERHKAFDLACLLRRRGDVQVEMDPWVLVRWCLAHLQRELGPRARSRPRHRRPTTEA